MIQTKDGPVSERTLNEYEKKTNQWMDDSSGRRKMILAIIERKKKEKYVRNEGHGNNRRNQKYIRCD